MRSEVLGLCTYVRHGFRYYARIYARTHYVIQNYLQYSARVHGPMVAMDFADLRPAGEEFSVVLPSYCYEGHSVFRVYSEHLEGVSVDPTH